MKFMNLKRFGSIVMAGTMVLSLAAPAFAADTTTITGAYQEMEIAVEIPTTGAAQINPYGLPVSIDKADKTTVEIVNQKITTQPMSIRNQGTVALDVGASLTVLPKGDVVIKPSFAAGTDKGKEMKIALEVAGLNDSALAIDANDKGLDDLIIDKFVDDDTWTRANTLAAPAAAKGITTAPTPEKGTDLAVLGAATVEGKTTTYGAKSIALFRLSGELNAEPEKAEGGNQVEDPWTTEDGFTATVVFKFTPHANVAASVALDKNTLTLTSPATATGTLTATFDAGDSGLTVTKYDWSSTAPTTASVTAGGTATNTSTTVTYAADGTATVKCIATLSDGSTVEATCTVTCAS